MINLSKLILCALSIFLIQVNSVVSGKEVTDVDQQKINLAVDVLKNYANNKAISILEGNNYTKKPVTIIFKDLSEVNFSYSKFYAVTATDSDGNLYILINKNLRNSDERALACLIAHESMHCRKNVFDSVDEEIAAHMQEVMLYIKILSDNENLKDKTDDVLVNRLNKLKKIYDDAMKAYITSNSNYVNYLKTK